jgi:nitrogen regulatory protein P-II 1
VTAYAFSGEPARPLLPEGGIARPVTLQKPSSHKVDRCDHPARETGAVVAALENQDAYLLSMCQVLGDGREPGYTEVYRGRAVRVRNPKLRLEVMAEDLLVEGVVEAFACAAAPGDPWRSGDGQILFLPVEASVPICERDREPMAGGPSNGRRWPLSLLNR